MSPSGVVHNHIFGRAVVLLADQWPSNRRNIHVTVEHHLALRYGRGQNGGARTAQHVDNQTVFNGRDERMPVENRNWSKNSKTLLSRPANNFSNVHVLNMYIVPIVSTIVNRENTALVSVANSRSGESRDSQYFGVTFVQTYSLN